MICGWLSCSAPTNGAEVVARRLQRIARTHSIDAVSPSGSEQGLSSLSNGQHGRAERAGSVRLRDAIVWGYMMQRPHARTKVCPCPPSKPTFRPSSKLLLPAECVSSSCDRFSTHWWAAVQVMLSSCFASATWQTLRTRSVE